MHLKGRGETITIDYLSDRERKIRNIFTNTHNLKILVAAGIEPATSRLHAERATPVLHNL